MLENWFKDVLIRKGILKIKVVDQESTTVSSQNSEIARRASLAAQNMVSRGSFKKNEAIRVLGHELQHRFKDDKGAPGRITFERSIESYCILFFEVVRYRGVGYYDPKGEDRSKTTLRRMALATGQEMSSGDKAVYRMNR